MITDPNVGKLRIPSDYISIFASGFSINEITPEEYDDIKKNTFVIGTNYFFQKFTPHMLAWSDIIISNLLHETYDTKPEFLLMSRPEAYERGNEHITEKLKVDFWYTNDHYRLIGNFTFFSILQLIKRFFPEKQILMFGLDFHIPEEYDKQNILKYYDLFTKLDFKLRNHGKYRDESLERFEKWMRLWLKEIPERAHNIFNCNLDSHTDLFEKKAWRDVIA